jgi:adenine C2-methylase RlmN of 23S rRNA A2503 and tRNA A37
MKINRFREFGNGIVYAIELEDGALIETTDTFLPFYTRDAVGKHQNILDNYELGDRSERWMIGVSVMSGCPVRCKFCATGQMKKWRNLTAQEIIDQVEFIVSKNTDYDPLKSKEFKINYTRMGEPFLNIDNVKEAIYKLDKKYPNLHHYVSTIGIKDSDFSWIKNNITLQISVHSTDNENRNWLIPYKKKMTLEELGKIRTDSFLKTTINLTLVKEEDFDINILKSIFSPKFFFVKISPINTNSMSDKYDLGDGIIEGKNLI